MSTLYAFAGLPATGKTTLARALARDLRAVYLRIDTVYNSVRESGSRDPAFVSYDLVYRLALDNLRLGADVVADCVNSLKARRDTWRDIVNEAGASLIEIEVICSDKAEHRARVETRTADIAGFILPNWAGVEQRRYDTWETDHVVIDTAGKMIDQSVSDLHQALAVRNSS